MIFNFKENKRMRIYKTKKTYFNGKDFLSLGVTLRALRALRLKQGSLLLALLLSLPFWACANVKGVFQQPPPPPQLPSLMAAGYEHTCAVVRGGMKCWGNGNSGQLGVTIRGYQPVPIDVDSLEPGENKGVSAVSAGSSYTCALVKGGVKCWGVGDHGRLGDGSTADRNRPVNVKGLEPGTDKGITAVSAGTNHTCAVLKGGLKCWGDGAFGVLGYGSTTQQRVPVNVKGLEPGENKGVTAVSAGNAHTCAVVQGGVKCWGYRGDGSLGGGSVATNKSVPLDVKGLGPYKGVTAVSAGSNHTCAVVRGGVKCWGKGDHGRLGDGSDRMPNQLSPIDVKGLGPYKGVTAVSAGSNHTCAVVQGGLKCWGNGQYGVLGDGLESEHNQLPPLDVKLLEPGTGKGVSAVSAGDKHTCAVVKGGVKCWGSSNNGRLGLIGVSSTINITTPMDVQGLDK